MRYNKHNKLGKLRSDGKECSLTESVTFEICMKNYRGTVIQVSKIQKKWYGLKNISKMLHHTGTEGG
jgi:hypothetical protein